MQRLLFLFCLSADANPVKKENPLLSDREIQPQNVQCLTDMFEVELNKNI